MNSYFAFKTNRLDVMEEVRKIQLECKTEDEILTWGQDYNSKLMKSSFLYFVRFRYLSNVCVLYCSDCLRHRRPQQTQLQRASGSLFRDEPYSL
jgi:hypothetical protein